MANPAKPPIPTTRTNWAATQACFLAVCVAVLASHLAAAIQVSVQAFDAAALPNDYNYNAVIPIAEHHGGVLWASERVGKGLLPGPEDMAYDPSTCYLYVSYRDRWVRRVNLGDLQVEPPTGAAVEDRAYVGGRPLGVAFGPYKQLVIAHTYKGRR